MSDSFGIPVKSCSKGLVFFSKDELVIEYGLCFFEVVHTVLFQLLWLELCSCEDSRTNMLVSLLQHSPKLQALKLVMDHGMRADHKVRWIQPRLTATIYPASVSLVRKRQMFEEVEIATRILRACGLTIG
ncbi:unnamed protein product [Brassica oleracea var. botrytis]|uniref:(rape) hypothetical protein n=2 Tax=Brassica TaxID=3705 RepID=A0A816J464_BRANA|nr:unnamed protein product [Brassica napus]